MISNDNDRTWAELIGEIATCRQALEKQDSDNWPMSIPGLGASSDAVLAVERSLGYELDPDYKALLSCANGWPNFISDISLFSIDDLGAGPAWARAVQLLTAFYAYPVPDGTPRIGELFPIGVSGFQNDVLAIIRTSTLTGIGRPVVWFANEEIERFANTTEMARFFLSQLRSSIA